MKVLDLNEFRKKKSTSSQEDSDFRQKTIVPFKLSTEKDPELRKALEKLRNALIKVKQKIYNFES